jgi:hypothetical protein
LNDKS